MNVLVENCDESCSGFRLSGIDERGWAWMNCGENRGRWDREEVEGLLTC